MPAYEHVSPGQPFRKTPFYRAAFQNDTIDVVSSLKEGRDGRSGPDVFGLQNLSIVKVKNLTGDDRARGEVVQLGAYLLDVVDPRRPWFEGNTVAEPVASKIAILRAPLKSNKIGEAQVAGVWVARVNVTDEEHRYAKAVDGEHVLDSANSGSIELLSPADGTGEQDMLVRIGANSAGGGFLYFTLADTKTKTQSSATANVDIHLWGPDPDENNRVLVHDPDPDSDQGFEGNVGDYGCAAYDESEDKWWIVWIKCPTTDVVAPMSAATNGSTPTSSEPGPGDQPPGEF